MSKQTFKIPVEWTVCDFVNIEAETLVEAVGIVLDTMDDIPLGTDPNYLDSSYQIEGQRSIEEDYEGSSSDEHRRQIAQYLTELGYNEEVVSNE